MSSELTPARTSTLFVCPEPDDLVPPSGAAKAHMFAGKPPRPEVAMARMLDAYAVADSSAPWLACLFACSPAGAFLLANLGSLELRSAAAGAAVGITAAVTAVATGVAAAISARHSIRAMRPFDGHGTRPLSVVEEAALAECARRVASSTSVLMRGSQWLRDVRACGSSTNEQTHNMRQLFALLFEGRWLQPSRFIESALEAIAHCLEGVPKEDLPSLRPLIESTIEQSGARTGARGLRRHRWELLDAALDGRPYSAGCSNGESASQPKVDFAIAELDFKMKTFGASDPEACIWGRTVVEGEGVALRVAAHWERAGFRVSIAPYPGNPEIASVVVYQKGKAPPTSLHGRVEGSS